MNKFALEQPLALAQIVLAIGIIEGNFFPGEMWFGGGDREGNTTLHFFFDVPFFHFNLLT